MDSLKIPKGGSSASSGGSAKPSSSVPITVRFNAGEDCIDDIFQSFHNSNSGGGGVGGGGSSANSGGGDSLSSSPSQHHTSQQSQSNADEVNTRNNFLQGNFFNRKRSGSIEGISPTLTGPNLIAALSSTDASSVGTWKLIKGKVSQTIEDIKSSKSSSNQNIPTVITKGEAQLPSNEPDSDPEIFNTSVSEEIPLNQLHKGDSDSDIENEILLECDVERSRLRRGFANLKSKVKAKSEAHRQQREQHRDQTFSTAVSKSATSAPITTTGRAMSGNDISPSRATTSLRTSFLRKRHTNQPVETADQATSTIAVGSTKLDKKKKSANSGKKDIEIESGVEMLEGMIPPAPTDKEAMAIGSSKSNRDGMDLPLSDGSSNKFLDLVDTSKEDLLKDDSKLQAPSNAATNQSELNTNSFSLSIVLTAIVTVMMRPAVLRFIALILVGYFVVWILPFPDFLRGVLSCLLCIALLESIWTLVQACIENTLITEKPEKDKFNIPDYSNMGFIEIPAVEEHKTVKAYSGWMNEVNSYDADNFTISMAQPVYVKLDGTIMRIYTTSARIPKKAMWNEPPIDRKAIAFTSSRSYDLLDCRIELLPLGLARKRFFNRKYPMQLIIKNCPVPLAFPTYETNTSNRPSDDSKIEPEPIFKDAESWSLLTPEVSNANEGNDRLERGSGNAETDIDFAATVLNADLQKLQDTVNRDETVKEISVPCGDEVRLILFARADREKEDWYRRFEAARTGEVHDQNLRLPNIKFVSNIDLHIASTRAAMLLTHPKDTPTEASGNNATPSANAPNDDNRGTITTENVTNDESVEKRTPDEPEEDENDEDFEEIEELPDDTFEGLLMSTSVARNPVDYVRFMALYQSACKQDRIPVYKKIKVEPTNPKKKHRRSKRREDELWKGINQSLFLGPSGSVVWANVLAGRVLYSILHNVELQLKIQHFMQKKLSAIKLPSFIEDVVIQQIDFGNTPPLIHRISQPMLDERGTWVDADVTYEGHVYFTVTTKLNLMRMKRPARTAPTEVVNAADDVPSSTAKTSEQEEQLAKESSSSIIYDSDAESSGGSSSEEESPLANQPGEANTANEFNVFNNTQGNARRIFKIVDRIATSNFFQYATDLTYVQRAMENMNANIKLRVDVKGLVSRVTVNIPPPPSDRVWIGFRGPPRLWITAKPAVNDKSFDYSIVTNVIESKLCEVVNKVLVYPNMVDVTIPILGAATYTE